MTTNTTIDPALAQRMNALAIANDVRTGRRKLKDRIRADATWKDLELVIAGELEPELVATMRINDLLLAAPALGPYKAHRLLTAAHLPPSMTFGRLLEHRRAELLEALRRMRADLTPGYVERVAARPRYNGALAKPA